MVKLSDSFNINNLYLKNRLVMAPIATGLAIDNAPSAKQINWYKKRATNGVGMIIVESCAVTCDSLITPLMLGLWHDNQIKAMSVLAKAIKDSGIPAILQINHGGARSVRQDFNQQRIGPSNVALMPGPEPLVATEAEIITIINAFAQSARRAVEAGFDGIEIHAAHYYLLSQFLSPYTNKRTDYWGGSQIKRTNLAIEIVKAVRKIVGTHYPILCRIHSMECIPEGMSTDEAIISSKLLAAAGVDVIDASGIGQFAINHWQNQQFISPSSLLPKQAPKGALVAHTSLIKKSVSIPVIAVGKLYDPEVISSVLASKQADLIALARSLIVDYAAASKILLGTTSSKVCQECGSCSTSIRTGPIMCQISNNDVC